MFSCKLKNCPNGQKRLSTKRHEAHNACFSGKCRDINETRWGHTPQPTVHNTIKYFTCEQAECQGNLFKSLFIAGQFLFTLSKGTHFPPLTKILRRDKMSPNAGMVELVDSVDLGDVTSVKVFPSRCHCEPVRRLVWQSVL